MKPIDVFLDKLQGKHRKHGDGYQCKCPAHNGVGNTSLSFSESKDGTILLKCFAGCQAKKIVESLGLELKDLFIPKKRQSFTVEEYSTAKKLPLDFLAANGVTNEDNYVKFEYRNMDGALWTRHRQRVAGKQFFWLPPMKTPMAIYGLWKLPAYCNLLALNSLLPLFLLSFQFCVYDSSDITNC